MNDVSILQIVRRGSTEPIPMEALTNVYKPRVSQTLPIRKGEGLAFWEREGTLAFMMGDDSDDEGEGTSSKRRGKRCDRSWIVCICDTV